MAFTAQDVKKLREMTNCGMMDCKKALTETDGDMDKAIEFLREKGLATAAKKADRIAAEGIVKSYMDGNVGVLVEVNSETDFVAKNDEFQNFVSDVAKTIAVANPADVEALKAEKCGESTIGDMLTEKIAKIGENMNIRRFSRIETDGVLVEADAPDCDEVKECLKNLAMQIAALSPKYLSSDDVPEEFKEHEKEILIAQLKNDPKNASKPDNIIEKMITGRLAKELKEYCLLEQEYVKAESKETVAQYVQAVGKKIGADVKIKSFVRIEKGEGIEKKEENFADEVASMIK